MADPQAARPGIFQKAGPNTEMGISLAGKRKTRRLEEVGVQSIGCRQAVYQSSSESRQTGPAFL